MNCHGKKSSHPISRTMQSARTKIGKLFNKFEPPNILCFGCFSEAKASASCFRKESKEILHHFFLLLIH
jgi:hypothetical protein